MDLLLVIAGLGVLVGGAELLVRGASRLATLAGVSPLVIGLTVVAFGTSAPELAVGVRAGLSHQPDIALGNVVGSNIFNVLFILGICAIVAPLLVSRQLVRTDVPVMIVASVLAFGLAWHGARVQWHDGLLLAACLVSYVAWSVVKSRREGAANPPVADISETSEAPRRQRSSAAGIAGSLALAAVALGALVLGARWLVSGATTLALALGISDLVVGLTIVAAGTSLPEVATSVIATIRNERDIAIGNVVGSNIFNVLGILGISAMVTPGGLVVAPQVLAFDMPVMLGATVACLPVFFTGFCIARWEGAVFLGSYAAYLAFLVLLATGSPAREPFGNALSVVLPLVVVTLLWTGVQALRRQRAPD